MFSSSCSSLSEESDLCSREAKQPPLKGSNDNWEQHSSSPPEGARRGAYHRSVRSVGQAVAAFEAGAAILENRLRGALSGRRLDMLAPNSSQRRLSTTARWRQSIAQILAVPKRMAQANGSSMAVAADWYVRHGIPVFPLHSAINGRCSCGKPDCASPGKHPRTEHGFKDATTDPARIAEWWTRWPDANIGMPTGPTSGRLALDVDPRNGGDASLERLTAKYGRLPETAEQVTGGGGRHYILCDPGISVPKTLAPGIDLKGDGGYIVLAPSMHASGRAYQWDGISGVKALFAPADPPGWLLEEIDKARRAEHKTGQQRTDKWIEGERNNRLTALAGSLRRKGLSREAIEAALLEENRQRCMPPLPEDEVRRIAHSIMRYPAAEEWRAAPSADVNEWPEPLPIQSELPLVEPFREDLLPASFRPLVRDISERMQVPPDYPAVITVLGLAGSVNRRATIQPKENDTSWVVVPNLWGGIIAPPGFLKSPVIQTCVRPLLRIQAEWQWKYDADMADYERENEEAELRHSAWREQYKASAKGKKAAPERPSDLPPEPKLRRLIVNDATFEALHQTMNENPAGILVIRDELTGWWSQLDRAGREGERAFCLEAWNGDTGHTIDRIGRGTIHVPACCMSMLGGIQPGRLRSYLIDALKDGPTNDGLIQRFQLLVWPDTSPEYTYVDRQPDARCEAMAARVFSKLLEMDEDSPARYRFAPDAQKLFIDWTGALECKLRGKDLHPALTSHLSKYRKLMPALALLFELADRAASGEKINCDAPGESVPVSLDHTIQAAGFCEYLESHAQRIYSCVTTPQMRAAQMLAEKIKTRKVAAEGAFTLRDVYLKGWSGLHSPELVRMAVEVLEDASWVRVIDQEVGAFGGRPSSRYFVNPRIWK